MSGSWQLQKDERLDDLLWGGLKLIQSASRPAFSLDAPLLADFAEVPSGSRVLDLGVGSGVIALLLAVKQPDCHLTGLELMEQMADSARRSVAGNGLTERIRIVRGDVREAAELLGRDSFDIAVSNPPYYKVNAGRANADELFAAARSEKYGTLQQFIRSAAAVLRPGGWFYVVYRAERAGELFGELAACRLHLTTLRFVQPYADRPANLLLAAARKCGRGLTRVLPPLTVYRAPGCYSAEMEDIYARYALPGGYTHREP